MALFQCSMLFLFTSLSLSFFFFFKTPAPTEIYPLSLHDPLPIYPRAALERERRGVELHRIDEEPPLDVEPRLPRPLALELPAQNLEQHLGEPVLARVEDGEQDVRERPAAVLDDRRAAAGAAVGERIGGARRPAFDRDALAEQRRRQGARRVQVGVRQREGPGRRLAPH